MRDRIAALVDRGRAYRATFLRSDDGKTDRASEAVLRDLARFCCVSRTTIRVSPVSRQVDVNAMLISEGRREVFLHLAKMLRLSDADIARFLEPNEGA